MIYKVTLQDKSIASIESDDVLYEDGAVIFINDDGQIVALFTPGSALHVISEPKIDSLFGEFNITKEVDHAAIIAEAVQEATALYAAGLISGSLRASREQKMIKPSSNS